MRRTTVIGKVLSNFSNYYVGDIALDGGYQNISSERKTYFVGFLGKNLFRKREKTKFLNEIIRLQNLHTG